MEEEDKENLFDELARDLQNNPPCQAQSTQITISPTNDISEDSDLEKYINVNAQKSGDVLFQVINQFAKDVGDDAERAEAFSKLMKSNTDLLKILNDRLVKERQMKTRLAIAKLKEDGENMDKLIESQKSITMNRDELFKELLKDKKDEPKKADIIENED